MAAKTILVRAVPGRLAPHPYAGPHRNAVRFVARTTVAPWPGDDATADEKFPPVAEGERVQDLTEYRILIRNGDLELVPEGAK